MNLKNYKILTKLHNTSAHRDSSYIFSIENMHSYISKVFQKHCEKCEKKSSQSNVFFNCLEILRGSSKIYWAFLQYFLYSSDSFDHWESFRQFFGNLSDLAEENQRECPMIAH